MRRSVLIRLIAVALVAGALPALSAVAADAATARPLASRAAGRTLVVRVAGLTAGHKAHIHVTGPKHYQRSVVATTTLRHLPVGTYHLTVAAVSAPKGARLYPTRRAITAHVKAKRRAVASVRYAILVPKTTKTVSPKKITSVTNLKHGRKLVKVRSGTGLKKGDVLATGVSAQTPHGLLVKVVSLPSKSSVIVAPASLLDALPTGQIDAQELLTSGDETPQARRAGLHFSSPNGPVEKKVDEPLGSCSGSVEAKASGSISISPAFHLSASWSWLHGVTSASLTASITQSSQLKASISASGSCKGEHDLFKKPVTFATFVVEVGPVPIVLQPQLQITLSGEAKADAAITTSVSQSLTIEAGLQWKRGHGVSPIESVTKKLSHQAPTLTASGDIEVSVNPEINLLIDGVGGPEVGLTGGLELSADTDRNPWWTLDGYLAGNVGIKVPLLRFDKRVELVRKTWEIAHAGERADPTIDVSPDLAFPWNSDVCGFDTSLAYFDVDGSNFPAGSSVDISTDWTDYGSADVASDGTLYAEEPVGEVPNADESYYGVYAGPASSSVELNANSCVQTVSDSDGVVTLQWGVNGYEPDTEVDLLIDDDYTDSGTIDDGGSGGSTVSFDCPDDGEYVWDVEGTDNGHGESNQDGDITRSCTPADASTGSRKPMTAGPQVVGGAPTH